MLFAASASAESLKDIEGYEFEREILILQSLGIVSGDENSNFNPDDTVKRSEAAKLLMEAFAYDAEYPQRETEFDDVPDSHWASGYIQEACDIGYIQGVGEGNYAPDDEITLEQACTLMIRALGYELFTTEYGGYPNGYMYYARELDLVNRIDTANTEYVTRGELAYIIASALETPMIEYIISPFTGGYVPYIMNGRGTDYLCAMIKYHNAYFVSGMITGTYRSGAAVKKGHVQLEVNYAVRLGDEYINLPKTIVCSAVDGEAVYDLLFYRGEFILKETEEDTYEIVMIIV